MHNDDNQNLDRRALLSGLATIPVAASGRSLPLAGQTPIHFSLNPGLSIDRFGARPDASSETNWKAFSRCLAQCLQDGQPLLIPAEQFEIQPPRNAIDVTRSFRNARRAIPIVGTGGPGNSVLSLKTGGLHFASSVDWFDATFEGFSIIGSDSDALLEIGNRNFSDPVNMMRIRDVYVENISAKNDAVAVRLNYIAPGSYAIGLKANARSDGKNEFSGIALQCRQVEAMSFIGGAAGNGAVGVQIVDGFNFALSFTGMTFENTAVGVQHVSDKSGAHIFQGCQFSNIKDWSIESLAANSSEWIEFIACNFSMPGLLVNPNRCQNVKIRDRRNVETPTIPQSDQALTNTTGRDLIIHIWGGEVSHIKLLGSWIPYFGSSTQQLSLKAGQEISLRWKKPPSWIWQNDG